MLKSELRSHIKTKHKTYKPCRNYALHSQCDFGNDCIYNHNIPKEGEYLCFTCDNKFNSKTNLIQHIKTEHGNEPCRNFLKGQCKYEMNTCFFRHGTLNNITSPKPNIQIPRKVHSNFFQNPLENWPNLTPNIPRSHSAPPEQPQRMKLLIQNIMTNLLEQMKPAIMQEIGSQLMMMK